MKYLLVNADDFGFSPGVNKGILQAHRQGLVTSTTVMVNLPAAALIIPALANNVNLGAGVHLNTTYGSPLLPVERVPSLVNSEGRFLRPEAGYGKVNPEEIAAEWQAQIDLFRSWGLKPSHLDSHHHVHTWPELREKAAVFAESLGVPLRFTDSETREVLVNRGVPVTERFIGDFYGEEATPGRMMEILRSLEPGVTELMCHPAIVDPDLEKFSSYTWPRNAELAALTNPEALDLAKELGIKLINYRQLQLINGSPG